MKKSQASQSKKYRDVMHSVNEELDKIATRQAKTHGYKDEPCCEGNSRTDKINDSSTSQEISDNESSNSTEDNITSEGSTSPDISDNESVNLMQGDMSIDSSSDTSELNNTACNQETKANTPLKVEPLKSRLAIWAIRHNITHVATNDLLRIIRDHVVETLPVDARTLLKTERKSRVQVDAVGQKYLFIGLRDGLLKALETDYEGEFITLKFNIDGLPLDAEGSCHVWPIQCIIKESKKPQPFLVAALCGESKPQILEDFLNPFIDDLLRLIRDGITFNEKHYRLDVKNFAFICDAPARAFIKAIKPHNSYFSCDKCKIEGVYYRNRMTYPDLNAELRTDQGFRAKEQANHHYEDIVSPLERLPVDMIVQFPLDYMHQVCLGVVKRIIAFWCTGKNYNVRLPAIAMANMTKKFKILEPFIPSELNRKISDFSKWKRWKATQYRLFLLYVGPVALREVVHQDVFDHFMLLSIGIYILVCSDNHELVNYANELLRNFVEQSKALYGKHFVVYNVHTLIHLANDVHKFGVLDEFSSFPFENFMKKIKRPIRTHYNPLEQLSRRYSEKAKSSISNEDSLTDSDYPVLKNPHDSGPLLATINGRQFSKLVDEKYTFTNKIPNNCCLFDISNVGLIENIVQTNDDVYLLIRKFSSVQDYYDVPCVSSLLNVFKVSNLSQELMALRFTEVMRKMVLLPIDKQCSTFVVIPLAHKV